MMPRSEPQLKANVDPGQLDWLQGQRTSDGNASFYRDHADDLELRLRHHWMPVPLWHWWKKMTHTLADGGIAREREKKGCLSIGLHSSLYSSPMLCILIPQGQKHSSPINHALWWQSWSMTEVTLLSPFPSLSHIHTQQSSIPHTPYKGPHDCHLGQDLH